MVDVGPAVFMPWDAGSMDWPPSRVEPKCLNS